MDPENVTAFIIGDPHFKEEQIRESEEMAEKCAELIEKLKPSFVVILGDTLHKHEIADNAPFVSVYYFLERITKTAPVYILIGNHDYINANQFLSDRHFFLPYKKWKYVTVVDKPILLEYENFSFAMCPYVPPGRFKEALDQLLKEGSMWDMVDCIFAHQEFKGCSYGGIKSEKGDEWDENFPPVISGHIHDAEVIGSNIFYTGTPRQHSFGESPNKKVWHVSFGVEETAPFFKVDKYSLNMKKRKIVRMNTSKIDNLDIEDLQNYHTKLVLTGSSTENKMFRESPIYTKLNDMGVVMSLESDTKLVKEKRSREGVSFENVLCEVIKKKPPNVADAFIELYPEERSKFTTTEIIFDNNVSDDDKIIIEDYESEDDTEDSEEDN
jgi:DNA repair exonuclease SbcCD nuclease subunit